MGGYSEMISISPVFLKNTYTAAENGPYMETDKPLTQITQCN